MHSYKLRVLSHDENHSSLLAATTATSSAAATAFATTTPVAAFATASCTTRATASTTTATATAATATAATAAASPTAATAAADAAAAATTSHRRSLRCLCVDHRLHQPKRFSLFSALAFLRFALPLVLHFRLTVCLHNIRHRR